MKNAQTNDFIIQKLQKFEPNSKNGMRSLTSVSVKSSNFCSTKAFPR